MKFIARIFGRIQSSVVNTDELKMLFTCNYVAIHLTAFGRVIEKPRVSETTTPRRCRRMCTANSTLWNRFLFFATAALSLLLLVVRHASDINLHLLSFAEHFFLSFEANMPKKIPSQKEMPPLHALDENVFMKNEGDVGLIENHHFSSSHQRRAHDVEKNRG